MNILFLDNISGTFYPIVIFSALLSTILYIGHLVKGFKMDETPLSKQTLFWLALIIPFYMFLFFGLFAWNHTKPLFNAEGLSNFITLSKLPLALLSLAVPFTALINNIHRTIQTNNQIEQAKTKNKTDIFYSHQKNCIEYFSTHIKYKYKLLYYKDKTPTSVDRELYIEHPYRLYKSLFPSASTTADNFISSDNYIKSILHTWKRLNSLFSLINSEKYNNSSFNNFPKKFRTFNRIEKTLFRLDKIMHLSGIELTFIKTADYNSIQIFVSGIINNQELINRIKTYIHLTNDLLIFLNNTTIPKEYSKDIEKYCSSIDNLYLLQPATEFGAKLVEVQLYTPKFKFNLA